MVGCDSPAPNHTRVAKMVGEQYGDLKIRQKSNYFDHTLAYMYMYAFN